MSLDSDSPRTASDHGELLVGAPSYRYRTSHTLMIGVWALLGITPWAGIFEMRYWWVISYVLPFTVLLALAIRYSSVGDGLQKSYVAGLLAKHDLKHTAENQRRGEAVWHARSSSGDGQDYSFLISFLYLLVTNTLIVFKGDPLDFHSFHGIVAMIGDVATMPLAVIVSLALSTTALLAIQAEKLDYAELEDYSGQRLALPEADNNDVEIAGLGVALQAFMRRAETYTIESTLLSALAFSVFASLNFSDQGPVESYQWITAEKWACRWINLPDSDGAFCVPDALFSLHQHTMFLVCAWLLACSISFLAVLVSRYRFNEAYKYTEELFKIAEVLNGKEESRKDDAKAELTREIRRLLDRARHGIDDLRPITDFMRRFRSFGLFCFVWAVGTCGLYFHWLVMLAILATASSTYFFGWIDKVRRRSTLLPKLQSALISPWHR